MIIVGRLATDEDRGDNPPISTKTDQKHQRLCRVTRPLVFLIEAAGANQGMAGNSRRSGLHRIHTPLLSVVHVPRLSALARASATGRR